MVTFTQSITFSHKIDNSLQWKDHIRDIAALDDLAILAQNEVLPRRLFRTRKCDVRGDRSGVAECLSSYNFV